MSTIIAFAGNLAEEPELFYTREGKTFVSCRVLVNRRVRNEAGEWIDEEPTAHNVKVYGRAAANLHASAGRGDRVTVQGVVKTESWTDKETGDKRTKDVVVVDNRFGDVAVSLRYAAARIERNPSARAVPAAG